MTRDNGVAVDEGRIEALLAELTLDEKVALLAGQSFWLTTGVARLGIPAMKVSDGPNGARGDAFAGGSNTSACFPVGIALAATWNTALVEQIGGALAEEARSKGAGVLLAPTVNIHRSPLNGRNFECYSEDPHLSARLAVAYITGLQNKGVGATVKHFVCNDSEFERNTISSEVDERALRELYLPPFEAAVREAGSWAVMSAYNKINGVYADENAPLLLDILRGEWGFDGVVMSDWFGTKSTVDAANNGLDLEMPGPPAYRGAKLLEAAQRGEVRAEAIDESARRVLRLLVRAGAFASPEIPPEQTLDKPEHRALIRRAAAEAIVLLKNDGGLLPLDPARHQTLAVIGPNAKTAQIMGGGSAQVNAHYAVSPFDGIAARAGEQLELSYELGCVNHKLLPKPDARQLAGGLQARYYASPNPDGDVVREEAVGPEKTWMGEALPGLPPGGFSARIEGTFTPSESGAHTFGLASAGLSRLFVNDVELIDNWTHQTRGGTYFGMGSNEETARVELAAGQPARLRIEYSAHGAVGMQAVRLGHLPPLTPNAMQRAAELASEADVALVFVGLNGDWESEGFDRPDMELPGEQAALIERVAAANPRTVVVLQSGAPVRMPWLPEVAAVVEAWYGGQETGNAIADVLFGDVPASGKLPQTFPQRVEDNPAFLNYPGENGRVRYGEGIFVGYRFYEKKDVAPLFPFGHGLSYTTFAYGDLRLSAASISPDDTLEVSVDVTNTGDRPGQEVAQLYVRDPQSSLARPHKELKGFAKLSLAPGETKTATFTLDRRALAFWDDLRRAWVAEAGAFEALVGSSSADIRARAGFELTQTASFDGPAKQRVTLSTASTMRELLGNDEARAVLQRALPEFADGPQLGMVMGMSLVQIAGFAPDQLSPETLAAIDAELKEL
jgi:beta-glucosidase